MSEVTVSTPSGPSGINELMVNKHWFLALYLVLQELASRTGPVSSGPTDDDGVHRHRSVIEDPPSRWRSAGLSKWGIVIRSWCVNCMVMNEDDRHPATWPEGVRKVPTKPE